MNTMKALRLHLFIGFLTIAWAGSIVYVFDEHTREVASEMFFPKFVDKEACLSVMAGDYTGFSLQPGNEFYFTKGKVRAEYRETAGEGNDSYREVKALMRLVPGVKYHMLERVSGPEVLGRTFNSGFGNTQIVGASSSAMVETDYASVSIVGDFDNVNVSMRCKR